MRLSRLMHSANWKYALGEFLLIVFGITFALGVNTWYANLQLRVEERDFLRRIRASLETDLKNVSRNQSLIEEGVARLSELRAHLEEGRPYSDQLDRLFAEIQFFYGTSLQTSIYESLRARGLDLISNDELQFALIELYEDHNDTLTRQNGYTREIAFNQMQPYVRENFQIQGLTAKPFDYEAILQDRLYINLIESKRMAAESFKLPAYREAVDAIRQLMQQIDDELDQ